jgi:hypothetical protein
MHDKSVNHQGETLLAKPPGGFMVMIATDQNLGPR